MVIEKEVVDEVAEVKVGYGETTETKPLLAVIGGALIIIASILIGKRKKSK